MRVYQHLEDQLTKAGADTDDILALTTTREGATSLRNYFTIADKKASAETAVKVAGATAKHCIVIHGVSTFLSGEGHNLDCDQECFTLANVAYSHRPYHPSLSAEHARDASRSLGRILRLLEVERTVRVVAA